MRILTDEDLADPPIALMRQAVADYIVADARGKATSPPRHVVDFGEGELIFTIGGAGDLAGFRVYQTFAKPGNPADTQLVAAWGRESAELVALVVGNRLGALRTGCIGGVAVDTMASRNAKSLAIVGVGRQAEAQLIGIADTRQFEAVRIWGRRPQAAQDLASRVQRHYQAPIVVADSAEQAVRDADVVVLATSAAVPVVDPDWIAPAAHVTTLGPKSKAAHELPPALADRVATIATDSPQQIAELGSDHILADTEAGRRVQHLGDLIGAFDPDRDRGLTLFLSIGLAGTEVAALSAVAEHLE
jgi:ornithine cyclodeaminase